MDVVMAALVCLMFWDVQCICKDEVGSITEVEGNINSDKCIDILDNNRLPVVLKFKKIISEFSKMTAPPVHQSLQTKL